MFKNTVKNRLFFLLLSGFASTQAFIYKVTVWKNENQNKHLYCLSDMHINVGKDEGIFSNDQQQKKVLKELIGFCKKSSTKVIVEDSFDAYEKSGINEAYKRNGIKTDNSDDRFLSLVALCQECGLDVTNVECRAKRMSAVTQYFSIKSLNQAIKNINNELDLYEQKMQKENRNLDFAFVFPRLEAEKDYKEQLKKIQNYKLVVDEIIQEWAKVTRQIRQFDDGKFLNEYYTKTIEAVQSMGLRVLVGKLTNYRMFFEEISQKINNDYRDLCVLSLGSWSAELLDMQALHELYQSQGKDAIFMIMGGAHIWNIEKLLPGMGYKLISTEGADCEAFMSKSDPYITHFKDIWESKLDIDAFHKQLKEIDDKRQKTFPQPIEREYLQGLLKIGKKVARETELEQQANIAAVQEKWSKLSDLRKYKETVACEDELSATTSTSGKQEEE